MIVILKNVGIIGQTKIIQSKVLIIGMGGLGCTVGEFLTRAGIGSLGIVDYYYVDLSNIHRQSLFNSKDLKKTKVSASKKKLNKINFDIKQSIIFAKQDGIVAKLNLEKGEYIDVGKILFAIVDEKKSWLEANLKETDLTNIKVGQIAYFIPDSYPDTKWNAQVQSISPATGAEFSILPPQNSSGNWVKVVQRIPVRISIGDPINKNEDNLNIDKKLRVGMSVSVSIDTEYESEIPIIIRPFSTIFKLLRD